LITEEPVLLGRGHRIKRPTWKVLEMLPQPPTPVTEPLDNAAVSGTSSSESAQVASLSSFVWCAIHTTLNGFGLFQEYANTPLRSPDDTTMIEDMTYNLPGQYSDSNDSPCLPQPSWLASINRSIFCLMNWMWTGSPVKSINEVDRLVNEVLLAPDFSLEDLTRHSRGFSAKRATSILDEQLESSLRPDFESTDLQSSLGDGWKNASLKIEVPDGKHQPTGTNDPPIPIFSVPNLLYRPITSVICTILSNKHALKFHLTPFCQLWKCTDNQIERVHGEVYSSDAYIDA
jgi:hypothetical protein